MPEPSGRPRAQEAQDGSESEGERGAAEGFRVRVRLAGAGACLLWAPRARRRLRWLAARLRRRARLRGPFLLLAAGAALPPAEPLRLLRPGDDLEVVPVEHEWQKPFSFEDEDGEPSPSESVAPAAARFSPSLIPDPVLSPGPTLTPTPAPVAAPAQAQDAGAAGDGGEALRGVKRRALALLRQVEQSWGGAADGGDAGDGADGRDEPDDAAEAGAPARKRRRRVRRRRAPAPAPLPPSPASSPPPEPPAPRPERPTSPSPPLAPTPPGLVWPERRAPAQVPGPAALVREPLGLVREPLAVVREPPAAAVRRNPSPARAPRLVRALPPPTLDAVQITLLQ